MFRKFLPLLAALMIAAPALWAATIDPDNFPADSADLSGNPYFNNYAFVAQGYGQFAGSEYSATTSGTTTIAGVECAVINESYNAAYSEYTVKMQAQYCMARDKDNNIHVLSYDATANITYTFFSDRKTINMNPASITSTLYYPSTPEVETVYFQGTDLSDNSIFITTGCSAAGDNTATIKSRTDFSYGGNSYWFSLYFHLEKDKGITQIDDGEGSGFAVQNVSAEAEEYLRLQQLQDSDDDDGYCFIAIAQMGRTAQTLMTLLLAAVSCLLGWFAIRSDRQ